MTMLAETLPGTWPVLVTSLAILALLAENALSVAGLTLFAADSRRA